MQTGKEIEMSKILESETIKFVKTFVSQRYEKTLLTEK